MPDALHDGLILASHETADQETSVGGKGMNLTRLVRGGLQVPPFFVVGTPCFRACVDQDAVRAAITAALADRDVTVLAQGEAASEEIRQAILAAPAEGLEQLVAQGLDEAIPRVDDAQPFVAVRSSCVGEDSAEASFAGQMDSYLFVRGAEDVAAAVKQCWASAFGARALAYRVQKGMAPAAVDMAVVVQEMIGGEVSGVMFTACPTTGHRDRVVISSTWGLGEGLVSG